MSALAASLSTCILAVAAHYGVPRSDLTRAIEHTPAPSIASVGVAHVPTSWMPLLQREGFKTETFHDDPCASVAAAGWILRYMRNIEQAQRLSRQARLPARAQPWQPFIRSYASAAGVDPNLVNAVILQESKFHIHARSSADAYGLMQLTPGTAKDLGVNRDDPKQNLWGGIWYLSMLLRQYGNNVSLALAAYNAGPAAVSKYGGIPPYKETQNYVPSVLRHYSNLLQIAQVSAAPAALPILDQR